ASNSSYLNCVFSGNIANTGSAMDTQGTNTSLINCSVGDNGVPTSSAAVRFLNASGTSVVRNSILYDNLGGGAIQGRQITVSNSTVLVDRCCIEGLTGSL